MADLSELLRKQEQRSDAKPKARLRITREGPTRPWQQGLPQYQSDNQASGQVESGRSSQVKAAVPLQAPSDIETGSRTEVSSQRPPQQESKVPTAGQAVTDERPIRTQRAKARASQAKQVPSNDRRKPSKKASPAINNRGQTAVNGRQVQDQGGTRGDNNEGQKTSNGGQRSFKRETRGDNNEGQRPRQHTTTGDKNGGQGAINGGQTASNGGQIKPQGETDTFCPPKKEILSPLESSPESTRTTLVPRLEPPRLPFQLETSDADKGGQFPTGRQELTLLFYLVGEVLKTGLNMTGVLKRSELADATKIGHSSIKKVRTRLLHSGHVTCTKAGEGRSRRAGCVYAVSEEAISVFKRKGGQAVVPTVDNKGGQSRDGADSSSRSLNKEPTKAQGVKALLERFDLLLERIQVPTQFNVDSTDVAGWWQKAQVNLEMTDDALEDFEESFERWVFKLSSSKFPEGSNPKAVLASNVLRGLCGGKVPGFVSWREREAKALEELRRERLNGVRRRQLAEYAENFEIWFGEAEDDVLWACVPEDSREAVKAPRGKKLQRGAILKSLVKGKYAEANDIDFEHWQHLAEQFT